MNISKPFILIILFTITYHILYLLPVGTFRYTITMLPILLVSLYGASNILLLILNKKSIPKIILIMSFILILFILLNSFIIRKDISRILEVGAYYLPLIGFYFLSKKFPLNKTILIKFLLFIFIPILVLYSLIGVDSFRYTVSQIAPGRFLIYFAAIHTTGMILLFLFALVLSFYTEQYKIKYLYLSFIIIIFIFYSGSRTSLLIAVFLLFIVYYIHKKNITSNFILLLIPILMLFSVYFIELLKEYILIFGFTEQLKLNQENITAGRAWLWIYHLNLFFENFFTGTSDTLLDISKGDYTYTGEKAQAGTESYYTKLLARDGIWSFIHIGFYLYLLYLSIKSRSIFAYFLIIIIIVSNATLSQFENIYGIWGFIGYWMLFSLLFNNTNTRKNNK